MKSKLYHLAGVALSGVISVSTALGISATMTVPVCENSIFPGIRYEYYDNPLAYSYCIGGSTKWDSYLMETTTGYEVETDAVYFTHVRATHRLYVNNFRLGAVTGYGQDETVYQAHQSYTGTAIDYECYNIANLVLNGSGDPISTNVEELATMEELQFGGSWQERSYQQFTVCFEMYWNFSGLF